VALISIHGRPPQGGPVGQAHCAQRTSARCRYPCCLVFARHRNRQYFSNMKERARSQRVSEHSLRSDSVRGRSWRLAAVETLARRLPCPRPIATLTVNTASTCASRTPPYGERALPQRAQGPPITPPHPRDRRPPFQSGARPCSELGRQDLGTGIAGSSQPPWRRCGASRGNRGLPIPDFMPRSSRSPPVPN
jgi:hypothetical protein